MRSARPSLVLLALLGACAQAQPPAADETGSQAVSAMTTALQGAVVRRDAAAIASLFANDAVLHGPDGGAIIGREAIEARIAALLPRVQGYSITSQRLDVRGDHAYDEETFQLSMTDEAGESRTLAGRQLVIVHRQPDGSWKVIRSGVWIAPAAEMHRH